MPLVLIDTNIYLDFYRSSIPKYRVLLKEIEKIAKIIYVPELAPLEFERNRIDAYNDYNFDPAPPRDLKLREINPHFSADPKEVDELNKRARAIKEEFHRNSKSLVDELKAVHSKNQMSIIAGTDDVSTALQPLFAKSQDATKEQLDRARKRKELGQPPGKRADPLGDQLSWEQFLDAASDADDVWIVSRDADYIISVDGKSLLRPTLQRELLHVMKGVDIRCFANLASFLDDLKNLSDTPAISATKEDLQAANNEIKESVLRIPDIKLTSNSEMTVAVVPTRGSPKIIWPGETQLCEKTGSPHRLDQHAASPSGQFGGWTYKAVCLDCGKRIDTGEPYDD